MNTNSVSLDLLPIVLSAVIFFEAIHFQYSGLIRLIKSESKANLIMQSFNNEYCCFAAKKRYRTMMNHKLDLNLNEEIGVILLPSERCSFFCDWVQDSVVNLFSRNEAFREM